MEKRIYKRTCKYCGKQFETTSNRQQYCGDDYATCVICGKQFKIREMCSIPKTCSRSCTQKQIESTCLEKYGDIASVNSQHGRNKAKKTCLEKYGVDHYSKTDEYKEKMTATCLEKFGTVRPLQNEVIKEKARATNQQRYGGNGPTCNENIKRKVRETTTDHYGGFTFQSDVLKEKVKQTNLERYGCENPMQSEAIQTKAKQTCLERYGHENYRSSDVGIASSISDPSKFEQFKNFKTATKEFILTNYDKSPTLQKLSEDCGVDPATSSMYVLRAQCQELVSYKPFIVETQVVDFLHDLDPHIQIKRRDRATITPYEIDIYLPDYKIGFECNPTVTHNSSFVDPWGASPKSYKYHQMKSQLAQEQGVFLFHIFGYEWNNRRDVVKSMIRNLLGKNANKIYARDTEVVTISHKECEAFLNENHRQGATYSKVYLGLKHRDDLVAVMTFNHLRNTIGRTKDCDDTTWELSRFCGKANTSIIGGASKLFKHFVTTYSPKRIISFSDVAHTKGNLYSTLGFKQVSVSAPSYVWVNIATDKYFNRVTCQKNNLRKLFDDPTIDIEHHTEREIMESRGFAKVFDSGVIKWDFEPLISV